MTQTAEERHLARLTDEWSVWVWACLRGAGFPARTVLRLAAPELTAAVDGLLDTEGAFEAARQDAIAAFKRVGETASAEERKVIGRALRRLWARELPEPLAHVAEVADAVARMRRSQGAIADQRQTVEALFAQANRSTSQVLREIAGSDRFREAILWQNRAAFHGTVEALLRQPDFASDAETRKREQLIASYLQRYCVKNDTIGFFGPFGWATFPASGPPVRLQVGPSLVRQRTVYFERWCIDALAQKLVEDEALRGSLAPRLAPSVWLEGTTLHHPIARTTELPLEYARVLAACDGERRADAIAGELSADDSLELDEASVHDLLAELAERKLILWTLEIPTAGEHPERTLREQLEGVAGPAGARALAQLDELEASRDAVARAAGDPAALDAALRELEGTFERLTGSQGTRHHGQAYAARTLVYEDCRRDAALELGPSLRERLGPPLSLILQTARWYTYEIATRYRRALDAVYHELRERTGATAIDYSRFWEQVPALFPGASPTGIVSEVLAIVERRWAEILSLPDDGTHRIERSSDELRSRIAEQFEAPHPGWPSARHHSPDVMIAARDEEALRRGDYQLVLGELHTAMNTLTGEVFLKEHEERAALVEARERDLPAAGIAPVWSEARTRADFYSPSRHDFDLEQGTARSARPREQVIPTGALLVEERDGALVVRTRDGRHRFDVIAFLEQHLIAESFSRLRLLPERRHTPRVTIDHLVLCRERWKIPSEELTFTRVATPVERFLRARAWARELELPRHLFVKVPDETKPCYVDLESPVFVEIFAKLARSSTSVTLTEMLPSFEECWLSDAAGAVYTSELRLAVRDARAWQR